MDELEKVILHLFKLIIYRLNDRVLVCIHCPCYGDLLLYAPILILGVPHGVMDCRFE